MSGRELHVASGQTAADTMRQALALSPSDVLVQRDQLAYGPLLPLAPLDRWRDTRQRFLAAMSPDARGFRFDASAHDLLTQAAQLASAVRITIWLGTGLADQVAFVWLVELCRLLGVDLERLRVVQFDTVGRGFEVVGAGVLSPDEWRAAPPPARFDAGMLDDASRAWAAVTASTPDALLGFTVESEARLPFIRRALTALLHQYPDVDSGLNAWEATLLRGVRDNGPRLTRVIGHALGEDMPLPDWPSDGYLWGRVLRLSAPTLGRPLLVLSGDTARMQATEVRLTTDGEAILAGRGHFIAWNGIDDHVAGIHLRSAVGDVWYRDGETLRRAR